jgi:predicted dehydrogenase
VAPMGLRIALLGCGPLGSTYAGVVAATGSTVSVVFDTDSAVTSQVAQQTGARIAPTLNDAVTAVGVDVVVVCLGGRERIEAITAAATARRSVFDALPLSAETVPALIAVQEAGISVGVDFRRRHDAGVREIVEALGNGEIGEVRSCSIVTRDDTMSFEESVIHDLDLARHVTGSDIVDLAGITGEQTAMLLLTHASGAITSIENSQHAPIGRSHRVELAGATGIVSSASTSRHGAIVATADGERRRNPADDAVERSVTAQWTSFVDVVRSGAPSRLAADAGAALLAGAAVDVALAEGRAVGLAELTSAP